MNRREVNHVETHRLRVIDSLETLSKCRAAIAATFRRAGKKFIPRGGAGGDAIDRDARRRVILRRAGTLRISRHQNFQLGKFRDAIDVGIFAGAHLVGELAQALRVRAARAFRGGEKKRGAFEPLGRQVANAGVELRAKFMLPSGEKVGPGLDRVFPGADFLERTNAAPAIVVDVRHERLVPACRADRSPFQGRRDNVVPILKNVGFDRDVLANDAFDRITAAVDERLQIFDDGGGEFGRHAQQ
jgi:hypothetical protein